MTTSPRLRQWLYGALACAFSASSHAGADPGESGVYFKRNSEGWFWYEDLWSEEPPPHPQEQPEPSPAPSSNALPEPEPLSAQWLKINMPKYLERAIDDPTPENVSAYFYLNRVWLDKGNKFSDVAQEVVTQDPLLDETTRRPLATYAANEMNREANRSRVDALQDIAANAGIYFFFHSECRYCAVQAPVLKSFADAHGFLVIPVSLDGQPLPGDHFPSYRPDTGQAQQLGVEQTPAMFLARPPDRMVLLAQGALSYAELTQRVLMAGKQLALIDEHRFEHTRPIQPVPSTANIKLDEQAIASPEQLVEQIRNQLRIR